MVRVPLGDSGDKCKPKAPTLPKHDPSNPGPDVARLRQTVALDICFCGTASFARCEVVLKPGGRRVVLGSLATLLGIGRPIEGQQEAVVASVAAARVGEMQFLAELAATGKYKPVIDRSYPCDPPPTHMLTLTRAEGEEV